jgi:hypothetical protein
MNKNLGILLFILLVVAGGLYFIKGNPTASGFDLSDREFKIENTEKVTAISVERKNYPPVIFNKKGADWFLNNGKQARPEGVDNIFAIMRKLRIKFIPNKSAASQILKSIDKDGIKVKFFDQNDNVIKSFMMGPDLTDGTSTAFLMEGATQPYAMEAMGFNGSIRTRFVFDMNEYESKDIFAAKAEDIKILTVKYPKDRPSSFSINKGITGTTFTNPFTQTPLQGFNKAMIEPYLNGYLQVIAEYNDAGNPYRDTISKTIPFAEITMQKTNGEIRTAKFFNLRNIEFGEANLSPKDPIVDDTRFSVLTEKNEFFLVQYRVVKKLFTSFDRFGGR